MTNKMTDYQKGFRFGYENPTARATPSPDVDQIEWSRGLEHGQRERRAEIAERKRAYTGVERERE